MFVKLDKLLLRSNGLHSIFNKHFSEYPMAEAENPTTSSVPNTAPTATPSVESAPVTTSAPAASVEATPVVTESAPAAQLETSLLGAEPVVETKTEVVPEVKVEEKKAEAEVKKISEGEKSAETKDTEVKIETVDEQIPTYDAFKFPEGFKVDEKATSEFSGLLGKLEIAKGDHAKTQEIGQQIVDLYSTRLQEALKNQTDYFVQLHEKQKSTWREELRKDPVIGKNGDDKAFAEYQRGMVNFLATNGGSKEEVTAFRKWANETGNGESPALVRLLGNLKSKIERYENESSQMLAGTKPATNKPAPGKGIMQSLYGKKSA